MSIHQMLQDAANIMKCALKNEEQGANDASVLLLIEQTGLNIQEITELVKDRPRNEEENKEQKLGKIKMLRTNKIEAVKMYRAAFGCGLREAMYAVEVMK